jgi:acetyl-CoA C-acetyltransferase/acetyl-CoA acyltransferase
MQPVYLVKGNRTPQAKSGTILKEVPAPYLGHYLVRDILDQTTIPNDAVDEVIVGNTGNPPKFPNVGRVIALEAGLDKKTSGYTVHRNCASGMEAVSEAFCKIAMGRSDVIFAGGVENMSQMPLLYNEDMTEFFIQLMKSKSPADKMKVLSTFRLPHLSPVIAIEQGLTDPFCGLNMGQTAETLAKEFKLTREMQDAFANESHRRAIAAQNEGKFLDEIVPIISGKKLDTIVSQDNGPRADSSIEKLAKLRPFFEKVTGTVTVGNACPITDGGSMWLLCSEAAVKKYNLEPMARMVDYHFHGLEPERMGLGPVMAMDGVFKRTGLGLKDMDLVEINEAFAAQVLSCVDLMKNKEMASRWNLDVLGEMDMSKLNVNGGAIALGHPVGSTGSRLIVTLAHELQKTKAKYGVASLCIGGGQGGAVIIENLKR